MPLDGSFDCLISVMNRRNIARLSNGSQFPITLVCSAPCALLTSPAWGSISSLKREVSSHPLNVRYFSSVLWHWGLPHHFDVRCSARLFRLWCLPHHLNVRVSFSYGRSSHFSSVGYYWFDFSSLRRELIDFHCCLRGFNASVASHVLLSFDFSRTVVVNV